MKINYTTSQMQLPSTVVCRFNLLIQQQHSTIRTYYVRPKKLNCRTWCGLCQRRRDEVRKGESGRRKALRGFDCWISTHPDDCSLRHNLNHMHSGKLLHLTRQWQYNTNIDIRACRKLIMVLYNITGLFTTIYVKFFNNTMWLHQTSRTVWILNN